MTVASEIQRIEGNISAAYTAADAKGATLPATENSDNLATCIASIPSGGSSSAGYIPRAVESGVLRKPTTSFTYSVPAGATTIGANVLQNAFSNSGISAIDLGSVTTINDDGCYGMCDSCSNITSVDLSHITSIGSEGLAYAFRHCSNLTGSIDLSGLTIVSDYGMQEAFTYSSITSLNLSNVTSIDDWGMVNCCTNCGSLTSVDLSGVVTIEDLGCAEAFRDCSSLTSVDLSGVVTIKNEGLAHAFDSCTSLTSVDLSSIKYIYDTGLSYTFTHCSSLTSVDLSGVEIIEDSAFFEAFENTALQSLSFNSLTSANLDNPDYVDDPSMPNFFSGMLDGVTGCTVHFPSNLQSIIGGWDDVVGGFGGTNTTVLFDLPATS